MMEITNFNLSPRYITIKKDNLFTIFDKVTKKVILNEENLQIYFAKEEDAVSYYRKFIEPNEKQDSTLALQNYEEICEILRYTINDKPRTNGDIIRLVFPNCSNEIISILFKKLCNICPLCQCDLSIKSCKENIIDYLEQIPKH